MQFNETGAWLKARRNTLDLTRADVASQIGCAIVTLEKIERGQRRPSRQMAELLSNALRIPPESRDAFLHFVRGGGAAPRLEGVQAPATVHATTAHLPSPLTSFVDREHELADARARLLRPDVRLLTLIGPPGIGKTRMGIQMARTVSERFAGGAWFVDLAPLSDPALVLPRIARALGLAFSDSSSLVAQVQNHLHDLEMLIVLDNFEQVVDAAPEVSALLKQCPGVKILVTSREPLSLYGEHLYPMPALSLPVRDGKRTLAQLSQSDAITLFVARAEAIQLGFALNAGNAQAIAEICLRLDGMPLAIELAAAQMNQFSPLGLLDALIAAPLQSLAGVARDVEPRQRSLSNAIQWSHDLLPAEARRTFNRLGVFAGGFTTEAALAICDLQDDSTLHLLAGCSLIKRDANDRWAMLEMIREFALQSLAKEAGDELSRACRRHAEYYAKLITQSDQQEVDAVFYGLLDAEQHNARLALRRLIDERDALASALTLAFCWYLERCGLVAEGSRWLKEVLDGEMILDAHTRGSMCANLSRFFWQRHHFEPAWAYARQAMTVLRETGDPTNIAVALSVIGRIQIESGEFVPARETYLEVLKINRENSDTEFEAGALAALGEAELSLGNAARATDNFQQAHALCLAHHWRDHLCLILSCAGLGEIALQRREYEHAREVLSEGIAGCAMTRPRLLCLDVLAGVIGTMPHRATADVQRAAKIWGATQALREAMGYQIAPGNRRRIDACIADARARIEPSKFNAAWREGRELSLDEAIALAIS